MKKALHFHPDQLAKPRLDGQLVLVPEGEREQWTRELEKLGVQVKQWPT
jgi:hypothetical protein